MTQQAGSTGNRQSSSSSGSAPCSKFADENRPASRLGNGRTSEDEAWRRRRPEFMRSLGLLPPYTVQDVKQAYLDRAKAVHPDLGGDVAGFRRLQENFETATEYAKYGSARLRWIATQVDGYLAEQEIIAEISRLGGTVDLEGVDWLTDCYGADFAQLAEKIIGIRLRGPRFGDDVLAFLARQQTLIAGLRKLDLAFSQATDEGLQDLRGFCNLRQLDLQGTRITSRGLDALRLPALEWLNVEGTAVRWWSLVKLRWHVPTLSIVTPSGKLKKGKYAWHDATTNGIFVENGHVELLAKIAEIQKHR